MNYTIKRLALSLSAALALTTEMRAAAGDLDTSFNPNGGANGTVNAVALQADGKVLIAGSFNTVNGVARNRVARLNTNGSLDTTFNIGSGANNAVGCLAIQSDGKVVIGGDFTSFNGVIANRVARLNMDGSYDATFNPSPAFDQTGGASGTVHAVAIQADGKVLIGGSFGTYRTVARNGIARLNANNGTLDTTFNPGTGTDFGVYAIAPASGGKVYIGGLFKAVNGTTRDGIARLNADGSLDSTFNTSNANGPINALVVQPDGKLLVGGGGLNQPGPLLSLMRLDSNGSRDTGFAGYGSGEVSAIQLAPDGKVLIGGSLAGGAKLLRRKADGSHDASFSITQQPNERVRSMRLTSDGKLVIAGDFTTYGSTPRTRVARVIAVVPPALRNISTRAAVQTGDRVVIAGFIITGGSKEVLLRGLGPSLAAQGVPGPLQDPQIELYNSSGGLINSNNNWRDTQQNAILETTIAPSDDRESALIITLGAGSYTVVLRGANDTIGNGLIELYDFSGGANAKLANISTRSFVGTGDSVLIGGFIVEGDDAAHRRCGQSVRRSAQLACPGRWLIRASLSTMEMEDWSASISTGKTARAQRSRQQVCNLRTILKQR